MILVRKPSMMPLRMPQNLNMRKQRIWRKNWTSSSWGSSSEFSGWITVFTRWGRKLLLPSLGKLLCNNRINVWFCFRPLIMLTVREAMLSARRTLWRRTQSSSWSFGWERARTGRRSLRASTWQTRRGRGMCSSGSV